MAELDGSADESERSPTGKTYRKQESKTCLVCGDRALGYNFNAITCESCKAFFRRNALRNKDFRCPFQDSCEVTSVTRRFCQRCRLKKCFEIGMKKEWILSEEEKLRKKRKIALNRARKIQPDASNGCEPGENSNEANVQTSCTNNPDAVAGTENQSESNSNISKNVGRGRPKGVRTRRRRYIEESPSPESCMVQQDESIDLVDVLEETSQAIIDPKEEPSAISVSAEGICSITSTNPIEMGDCSSSKSLARLFSDRSEGESENIQQNPSVSKRHHGPTEIPSSSVEVFEEEGLVAGLLRSGSESPNEQQILQVPFESSVQEYTNNELEANQLNVYSSYTCPMKKESNGAKFAENTLSEYFQEMPTFTLQYSDQMTTRCGIGPPNLNTVNCSESICSSADSIMQQECDKFDFNIQEALSMLQPGCRSREPTTYTQSVMDSIVNTAISSEYHAFRLFNNAPKPGELNSAEKMKMHQLYEANRGLLAPLCDDPNFKDLPDPSLINVINLTEIAIRRLIKMAKKISAFKTLCQEDQIGLLKAGCTELMILKSVSAYDPEKDSWKIKQDQHSFKNIKLKVLKAAPGNVYEEHKRFILAFNTEWRQDLNIMLLLSAIVLFTPERPFILHSDAIRHEQSSYLYLLKRYLECKYGSCEGRTHYYKLLERISHLHVLNDDHVRVFLEANPKEMEPLLIEIFDLKQS